MSLALLRRIYHACLARSRHPSEFLDFEGTLSFLLICGTGKTGHGFLILALPQRLQPLCCHRGSLFWKLKSKGLLNNSNHSSVYLYKPFVHPFPRPGIYGCTPLCIHSCIYACIDKPIHLFMHECSHPCIYWIIVVLICLVLRQGLSKWP